MYLIEIHLSRLLHIYIYFRVKMGENIQFVNHNGCYLQYINLKNDKPIIHIKNALASNPYNELFFSYK
jgi:hypothetical protein